MIVVHSVKLFLSSEMMVVNLLKSIHHFSSM